MPKSSTTLDLKPEELAAIVLGAIALIGCWMVAADTPAWPPLWAMATWTVTLAAAINLGIVFESGDANFAGIIILSAFLALGTGPAALITLIGVLVSDAVRALLPRLFGFERRSWRTRLIDGSANISMHGLSLLAGAALYHTLGGPGMFDKADRVVMINPPAGRTAGRVRLGSLYLLQEMIPSDDADAGQAVNISVRSTLRLLDLVNSLLDINKL